MSGDRFHLPLTNNPGVYNRRSPYEYDFGREAIRTPLGFAETPDSTNAAESINLLIRERNYAKQEDIAMNKYIASSVTFVSLVAENVLCHPFQVLRRQCQVHYTSGCYHLTPFTLVPTLYYLHQRQGLTCLWKGLGSVVLVRGISSGIEDLISKLTPWPKELPSNCSVKQFFQNILLKCISLAIVTPFYSASFVETVQSEIASEKPGPLDIFKEGFMRLINWNGAHRPRMIPIWVLILPSVALGITRYLFSMLVKNISSERLQSKQRKRYEETGALPKDKNLNIDLQASLIASIASDVVFYPCETILHRLVLQGTRTIVDNLDNGKSVLPVLTNYYGVKDCYESCVAAEGVLGLYKGFGALIIQYTLHILLIRTTKYFATEIGTFFKPAKPKIPIQSPDTIATVGKSVLVP